MTHPILIHGLPAILSQALAEAWRGETDAPVYEARRIGGGDAPGDLQDIRLLLRGAAMPARLAELQAAGLKAPVLLLGAAEDGLDAAEILPLPVRLGLLLERIDFYVHLAQAQHRPQLACGPYSFDSKDKKLRSADAEQNLTDKEAAILALLLDGMRPRGREDLLRDIWGYDGAIDTHTLETHIYRLRRKLAELGGAVDIVTAEGGYCLQVV